jgi:nicotinamidase-related amidase
MRYFFALLMLTACGTQAAGEPAADRTYDNRLTPLKNAKPILADFPQYVEPITEPNRFEAAPLIEDAKADLEVRAWRFSYNARGIIEIPNRLEAAKTAVIVVHPWGIDDGQGWNSPDPAGCAFMCTPQKNKLYHEHVKDVLNPFLKALRGKVGLIAYSLPGNEDAIRKKLYRSIHGKPTEGERKQGALELSAKLTSFSFKGQPVPATLKLAGPNAVREYFKQFPGLDAGARFNNDGFWQLPIPVVKGIDVDPADLVIYDADGYAPLRDFLNKAGIRHILLAGYATDMCVISTTAGYQNLSKDFNLFLVGDATLATFPAVNTPRHATQAALAFASLNQMITQVSWVRPRESSR